MDCLAPILRWKSGSSACSSADPAMIFQVQLETTEDGQYEATCTDPALSVLALSSASALEQLRSEIRYRMEYCPCSSVDDDFVQLQIGQR